MKVYDIWGKYRKPVTLKAGMFFSINRANSMRLN